MPRFFGVAKCCLNCAHRQKDSAVTCDLDGNHYSGRIVCSQYSPTQSNFILAAERRLLPQTQEPSMDLKNWLKQNGCIG